jgi:hypothetical protein
MGVNRIISIGPYFGRLELMVLSMSVRLYGQRELIGNSRGPCSWPMGINASTPFSNNSHQLWSNQQEFTFPAETDTILTSNSHPIFT